MQKAIDLLIQQIQRQGFSVVLLCIAVYALWTLMQLQQQEHRIQIAQMNVRIDELTVELTACNAARLRQEGELNLLRKQIDNCADECDCPTITKNYPHAAGAGRVDWFAWQNQVEKQAQAQARSGGGIGARTGATKHTTKHSP